jgi:hypothetical protein
VSWVPATAAGRGGQSLGDVGECLVHRLMMPRRSVVGAPPARWVWSLPVHTPGRPDHGSGTVAGCTKCPSMPVDGIWLPAWTNAAAGAGPRRGVIAQMGRIATLPRPCGCGRLGEGESYALTNKNRRPPRSRAASELHVYSERSRHVQTRQAPECDAVQEFNQIIQHRIWPALPWPAHTPACDQVARTCDDKREGLVTVWPPSNRSGLAKVEAGTASIGVADLQRRRRWLNGDQILVALWNDVSLQH